jgi:hypothetical protein
VVAHARDNQGHVLILLLRGKIWKGTKDQGPIFDPRQSYKRDDLNVPAGARSFVGPRLIHGIYLNEYLFGRRVCHEELE